MRHYLLKKLAPNLKYFVKKGWHYLEGGLICFSFDI